MGKVRRFAYLGIINSGGRYCTIECSKEGICKYSGDKEKCYHKGKIL